jgi:pimeloyl-ACP methyl ester carboxylesterase
VTTYDEFALLSDCARDHGIRWRGRPAVERVETTTDTGQHLSALRWGSGAPEIVLLHGGAQNAHTWDAVALALQRPLLCVDLPGHGRSQWRHDHDYRPPSMVADVVHSISTLAPKADLVGGMSLGGMTAIAVADARPDLVRRLAIVDVAPHSGRRRTGPLFDFIDGPETFASLDEIVDRAERFSPTRGRESLRRGILHNAVQQRDGSWRWRWDPTIGTRSGVADIGDSMLDMWDAVGRIGAPTLLVTGANSPAVSPEDVNEWQRRQPHVQVVSVEGAGHAVQSDQPVALAQLLADLLETTSAAPTTRSGPVARG